MELLQLRYFLTVAKTLNISHAAAHHMIPQPAMSQTISKLEKELGQPLFDRHKNKLKLTDIGEEFYRSVSMSLGELDRAVQESKNADGSLHGELNLLVQQHRETVVDCIVEFKKLHPDVYFRLFYTQDSMDCHDLDLCIASTPPSPEYTDRKCLVAEHLQLLVSVNHPMAHKDSVHFDELTDEEFALLDRNNSLWQNTLFLCHQSGFEPKISMVCGDLHCLIKYVSAGMTITIGPELSWRGIKNGSVVFIPTIPDVQRLTYVFWNGTKTNSKTRSTFLNFLIEYFANRFNQNYPK